MKSQSILVKIAFTLIIFGCNKTIENKDNENSTASKKELNLENIDNGSYILYVRQNEFKAAYKIIKQ